MKRYARDLTANDILIYEPQIPTDIYGMAIEVKTRGYSYATGNLKTTLSLFRLSERGLLFT